MNPAEAICQLDGNLGDLPVLELRRTISTMKFRLTHNKIPLNIHGVYSCIKSLRYINRCI